MKRMLIFALALSACVESALNPTDKVNMTGQALNEDKSPLANASIKLFRDGSSTCIIPGDWATLTTDAQGNFSKDLTGADAQTSDGIARCFRLQLPVGDKGAAASADFLMQVTAVKAPALQRWNGAVAAAANATTGGQDFTFTPITQTQPSLQSVAYSASVTSGGGTVWRVASATSPVSFDKYMLEDFAAASAQAVATSDVKGSGTTFHFSHGSDSIALTAGTLVPASRGATCAYNKAPTACPLTDGKLSPILFDTVPQIDVTLGAPKIIRKVVLRGYSVSVPSNVVLEGALDSQSAFTKLADVGSGQYQEIDVPAGAALRVFRLRGTATASGATFQFNEIDEISLFE